MTHALTEIQQFLETRFDQVQILGEGGMCRVYRGLDRDRRRPTAIKVLLPESRDNPEARLRFVREMKLLERWSHPNLIEVFDTALEPFPWYSMRLLTGFSLSDHLDRMGALPLQESLTIARDIFSALKYIHRDGYLHRDIKPANVLLDENGRAYLADLGLAGQPISSGLTRQGMVMGTPYYIPPEHLAGTGYDKTGDIFSAGLLLVECLTGHRYYRLLRKPPYREPVEKLETLLAEKAPRKLLECLQLTLAEDPRDRFASASKVSQLIEEVLAEVHQRERFEALQELVTLDLVTLGPLLDSLSLLSRLDMEQRQNFLEDLQNLRKLQLHCWEINRRTARFEGLDDENSVAGVEAWKLMASSLGKKIRRLLWDQELDRTEMVTEAVRMTVGALRESLTWARVDPLESCLTPLIEDLPANLNVVLPDDEAPVYGYEDLEQIRGWIRGIVARILHICAPSSGAVSLFVQHRVEEMSWVLEIKGRDLPIGAAEARSAIGEQGIELTDLEMGGLCMRWPALMRSR